MKAVVTGVVATWPVGGVAWVYLQYAAALEAMGFDVTYLEDASLDGYDPLARTYTSDLTTGVRYLEGALSAFDLDLARAGRWHVRDTAGTTWGMASDALVEAVTEADVFLNVSGLCLLRDEYLASPCKVLIDTDPGWNHLVVFPRQDRGELWPGTSGFRAHDHFFTVASRIGQPDCTLPQLGVSWHSMLPVVMTNRWTTAPPGDRWTTILTWDNYTGTARGSDGPFGSKGPELAKIEDLPDRTGVALEIAAGGVNPPVERWRSRGWSVVDGPDVTATSESYQGYIAASRGELSVAKQVYVATGSGWFSDRSACYLAAGRPVVVQDTGWSATLPPRPGLLSFATVDDAAAALAEVEADPAGHGAAARDLAETHFEATVVLADLLDRVGVS